jgi:hypothetical protein
MRARRSSAEMGIAAAVMDFGSAADGEEAADAMDCRPALIEINGTPAAAPRKTRLDSMLIPSSFGSQYTHRKHTAIRDRRDLETLRCGQFIRE